MRMLKVMVADDERYICQFISRLLDWEQIGFELIGLAEDGVSAFNMIKEKKPDVVITDIRMPEMDGMEIVRKTKESGLNVCFVIISGYKCFEYAQSALKYGVEDYLLKPIKKAELLNIMVKIRDRFRNERLQRDQEVSLKNKLMQSIDQLRDQFLIKFLADSDSSNKKFELETVNSNYHMNFSEGVFQLVLIKLDSKDHAPRNEDYHRLCKEKFAEIMDQYVCPGCYDIQSVQGDTYILNYAADEENKVSSKFRVIIKEMGKFLGVLNLCTITIGLGEKVSDINDLYKSKMSALDAIRYRIVEGKNKVIDYSSKKYADLPMGELLTSAKETTLINIIDALDISKLKKFVMDIFDTLSATEKINPTIYYEFAEKIFTIFIQTMNKIGQKIKDEYLENIEDDLDIADCQTPNEIKHVLLERISEIFNYYDNHQKTNAPVRVAISYIARNYNKTITLNQIAEIVNLNPVYFSVIFKKEMGINFIDYLVNYRIEAAKKLLENCKYNIAQVSEMVGYTDPKHFSRSFKKKVGINPMEYRRIHS